jgi:hypothetical protein
MFRFVPEGVAEASQFPLEPTFYQNNLRNTYLSVIS